MLRFYHREDVAHQEGSAVNIPAPPSVHPILRIAQLCFLTPPAPILIGRFAPRYNCFRQEQSAQRMT